MQPTPARYARPLRWIHWLLALLVMVQLAVAVILTQLRSLVFGQIALGLHRQLGLTILVVLLIRLAIGRRHHVPPPVDALPVWQRHAATLTHGLLMGLLILQPVIGILFSWARADTVTLWGLIPLPAPFEFSAAALENLTQAHIANAVLLFGLVLVHLGAVAFNRMVRGVSVTERMLPAVPADELRNRMPIAMQMLLAFGLLIAMTSATGLYTISKYREVTKARAALDATDVAAAAATRAAQVAWKEVLGRVAATGAAQADEHMQELADAARSSLDEAAMHAAASDAHAALMALSGEMRTATSGNTLWQLTDLRSIDTHLQELVDSQSASLFQKRMENADRTARGHDMIVVALIPTVMAGIVIALLLARSLGSSLDRMNSLVGGVAAGRAVGAMTVLGRGEFARLMREMLRMGTTVEQRSNEAAQARALEAERVRSIKEDLEREAAQRAAAEQQAQLQRSQQRERVAFEFESQVARLVESVAHTVHELKGNAAEMARSAGVAAQRSREANTEARQTSDTASAIAESATQLSTAAKTVLGQATHSQSQAQLANEEAAEAKSQIDNLVGAVREIGSSAGLIVQIARRTTMLSINAQIEAAQAGESGRGFAVVATEVKELADKTRRATDDISRQLEQVNDAVGRSAEFLKRVSARIEDLGTAAADIHKSAGAQCGSTDEIASGVAQISLLTQSVSTNIDGAQSTAGATEDLSARVLKAAAAMEAQASRMQAYVAQFVLQIQEENARDELPEAVAAR